MKPISDAHLKLHFLGWQCRIRQIAMREYGGQPLAGMQPEVTAKNGDLLSPGMVVLLAPADPGPATAFFRFQAQRTHEPREAMEAGVKFLGAEYYQQPELFTGELTAVFAPESPVAARMIKAKSVLLSFEQFAQSYRMICKVTRLRAAGAAREHSLWHNRLFNPKLPNAAEVLSFTPDWNSVEAEPWPGQ